MTAKSWTWLNDWTELNWTIWTILNSQRNISFHHHKIICTVLKLHVNQDSSILKEIPTLLSASMEGEREMGKRYSSRVTSEEKAPASEQLIKHGPFTETHSKYIGILGFRRLREKRRKNWKISEKESTEELRRKKKENQFLHMSIMDRDTGVK